MLSGVLSRHKSGDAGAAKKSASREEILETMATAIYMGAGPSVMYAAHALEAFDQLAA